MKAYVANVDIFSNDRCSIDEPIRVEQRHSERKEKKRNTQKTGKKLNENVFFWTSLLS